MSKRRVKAIGIPVLVIAAAVAAFFGIVGPLFADSGTPMAEVTGLFDQQLRSGQSGQQVSVSVDNTGDTTITPLCVTANFGSNVSVQSVIFDNSDTEPIHNGRACGGALVGQETINVIFVVTARTPGEAAATVEAYAGTTSVATPLHGNIAIN